MSSVEIPPILGLHAIEDYYPLIGPAAVERIRRKAAALEGRHITHISSTHYGGGVAEILSPLTLLMNECGIPTDWYVIQGHPDFFRVTKAIHNGLQGADASLLPEDKAIYEEVARENSVRMHIDHDLVVIHDPQPLPLIDYITENVPALWCCHVDLSEPNPDVWNYLAGFVERFDGAIFSLPEYARELKAPQHFIMPAINPFALTNQELSEQEIDDCISRYDIPLDLPLILQVSRFDSWKDPLGVIEAFRLAQRETDCRLVLLGNDATDDPEGHEMYELCCRSRNDRIYVLSVNDAHLVNALQRRAAVTVQKSLREGFGLTVTEAMWKGSPVVGGNVGGIRHQIEDGRNGFLVESTEQTADRIVALLKDEPLRRRMGRTARETVREQFLLTRLLEDWLDLMSDQLLLGGVVKTVCRS